jgi:glycosyltransferase involved in cell wall biosynthesis
MPKILRIINRLNVGGPTLNAGYLTKGLSDEFETRLVGGIPHEGEAHSGFMLEQMEVPYHELRSMSRKLSFYADYLAYKEIGQIIREFKPDIVHTHASKAGVLGRLAAIRHGVPVVVHTYHGHVFEGYFSPFMSKMIQRIERFFGRYTHGIVAISDLQQKDLVEKYRIVPATKTRVIRLGFDLSRFGQGQELKREQFRSLWKIAADEIAIGIVGRIAPIKNHEMFAEVSHLVAESLPEKKLVFVIVGDGHEKGNLETVMHRNIASMTNSRFLFTSWQKRIDEVMSGLDLVVLTSLQEGTPVSLIEAQAAGRAIASTRVGGVADCVPYDNHNNLCASGDAIGMSRIIIRLIENENERRNVETIGKQFVLQEYDKEKLIERMRSFYFELLKKADRK